MSTSRPRSFRPLNFKSMLPITLVVIGLFTITAIGLYSLLAPTRALAANLYVAGTTGGCFVSGAISSCPPGGTGQAQSATLAGLTYNGSKFSVTTANGFAGIGDEPSPPNNLNNLGSFTLDGTPHIYDGGTFSLVVTFTAPLGITSGNPATYTANLTGTVTSNIQGGIQISFINPTQTFAFSGGPNGTGSFSFTVNNISLDPNNIPRSLTGFIQTTSPPTAAAANIGGRITTDAGTALGGVSVALAGLNSTGRTITDAAGNYSFANVETNGFYTVSPSLANYHFGPTERSFSLNADKTDATFTAMPDAIASANPLDADLYFIRQQYVDFLGREPDREGLLYWANEMDKCGTNASCLNARRTEVAAAFFVEQEYQQTGSYVYRLYKAGLGRQVNYSEFSADRQQVIGGSNLDQSKASFADAFVQRPEFAQKYADQSTAESFVDKLLSTAGNASTVDIPAERDRLIEKYKSGGNLNQSRSLAVQELVENASFKTAEYNRAFVLMQYFGYLKREPEPDGFKFWLNVLNNKEPENYRGMVCSFITSAEYQSRFSSFISHNNKECR